MHYFYGHYYAVQAMWTAGGDYWAEWYPAIRDELIRRQQRRLLGRPDLPPLRHGDGLHHPPGAQQLPAHPAEVTTTHGRPDASRLAAALGARGVRRRPEGGG